MRYLLLILPLLVVGCGTTEQYQKADDALYHSAQVYVEGASDALDLEKEKSDNVQLADRLVKDARKTLGEPDESLNIPETLKNDKELKKHESQDSKNLRTRDEAEKKLIDEGKLWEAEHHKSVVRKIWEWAVGVFGLGGIITLCIFFPALIPVILNALGWILQGIIRCVPSVVHLFGVVGKATLDNVVKGVGNTRDYFQKTAISNPEKTFSAQQVQDILNSELSASTDGHDKAVIDSVRRQFNV